MLLKNNMKIFKSYLKQIINEELVKELKGSKKARNVLEEKKIQFKYLLNGKEQIYEDYDVLSILNSYSTTGTVKEMKRQVIHHIKYNLGDHPELNKNSSFTGNHKYTDLLKSYNNLYGDKIVQMIYDLSKDRNDDISSLIPDEPFQEIKDEFKYEYVADFYVTVPFKHFNTFHGHIEELGRSKTIKDVRRSLLFALENMSNAIIPKNTYGHYPSVESLVKAFNSNDINEQKKYNGFFPLSLTFTNVLTDRVEKGYKDCSIGLIEKKEYAQLARQKSAEIYGIKSTEKKIKPKEEPSDTFSNIMKKMTNPDLSLKENKINKSFLKQIILEELTSIKGGGQGSGLAIGKLSSVGSSSDDAKNDINIIKDLENYHSKFKSIAKENKLTVGDFKNLFKKISNVLDTYDLKETEQEKQKFNELFINNYLIPRKISMPNPNEGLLFGYSSDTSREKFLDIGNTSRWFIGALILYRFYDLENAKKLTLKFDQYLGQKKDSLKLGKFISKDDPRYSTHDKD